MIKRFKDTREDTDIDRIQGYVNTLTRVWNKHPNLVRLSILFGCHIDDILVHNMTAGEDENPLLPSCA